MNTNRTYSPAEICQIFNVSKSTLLRWERDGILPPIGRGMKSDQRQYTQSHVRTISEKLKAQLVRQYSRSSEMQDIEGLKKIHEVSGLQKIIRGDLIGLYELAEFSRLSPEAILQLAQIAIEEYEPASSTFSEIMKVVTQQSSKLNQQGASLEEV